jgi:hypothetical protein
MRPTRMVRLRPGYSPVMNSLTQAEPLPARLASGSWWFRSSDGELTLWQLPNPALAVWLVTVVLGLFDLPSTLAAQVEGVRHGALLVWALDEVVRGTSPFRRALGAVVFVGQVALLALG